MRSTLLATFLAGLLTGMLGCGTTNSNAKTNGEEKTDGGKSSAKKPGTEEFGLTQKELVQAVEKVEALIAKHMREEGFEYVPCDYQTIRKGMIADKNLPGISEETFISRHGFGVSTFYTGKAPQLAEGYSPAREGLGERNVQVFKNLSAADQVAYNRALFGENTDASFAVSLETENFSRCGGCTRKAIEQVFKPNELKPDYYNPKDALINDHDLMKAARLVYASKMREAGYTYDHPDEVETDIRQRLNAITRNGTIPVEKMTPEQLENLKKLQDYERVVAKKNLDLQGEIFEPVEEKIERLLFSRDVK